MPLCQNTGGVFEGGILLLPSHLHHVRGDARQTRRVLFPLPPEETCQTEDGSHAHCRGPLRNAACFTTAALRRNTNKQRLYELRVHRLLRCVIER